MTELSVLGPIDPNSVADIDDEKHAPWIVRKLAGSLTGRIVRSSLESLRAAGTSVVCLSPWGDSNPLLLPCVRFRDLAVHAIVIGTGGVAAVAAPVMGPATDIATSALGGSILVEIGISSGFKAAGEAARELAASKTLKHIIPEHAGMLVTTGIKVLTITLKHKMTQEDANLGFYRSSSHGEDSLFDNVKDYLSIQKGWFSPYLFASARRPAIPRNMDPDFVFGHGPFLTGDYEVGTALLNESAMIINLCAPPPQVDINVASPTSRENESHKGFRSRLSSSVPSLSKYMPHLRSRTPSPEPALSVPQSSATPSTASLTPPVTAPPRRLVILFIGIKPFRKIWTSSARPGESVIRYILFNGSPAVVVPAKLGSPLVAWHAMTLERLRELQVPKEGEEVKDEGEGTFGSVVKALCEYVMLCVDWERVVLEQGEEVESGDTTTKATLEERQAAVKNALTAVVVSAVKCKGSKQVDEEVEDDRAGIVIFRIP